MTKEFITGNVVSKTNWMALVIVVLGYVQMPEVRESLLPWVDEKWLALANMVAGLVVIVIRNLTYESVAAKGAKVLGS